MSVFPRRVSAKTHPFPDGPALAFCPVGVVRDVCGAHWRLLADGMGWKLTSKDDAHVAFVRPGDDGTWIVRLPRDPVFAHSARGALDALAFAGSVSRDAGAIQMDGPSHFRFVAAQQRRADRNRR